MTTTDTPQYQLVIDGRRVEAASGQRYDTVDPYLGAPWASAADGDAADVDAAVAAARRALAGPWGQLTGFGLSGLGRENGIDAVHEYTQTKAIWVELTGGTRDPFTLG